MRSVVASVLVLLIFISTFSMLASKIAAAAPSTEWTETYGGSNNDSAYHVVQTSDGGYAIAGDTESYGGGNDDFWLVKTNFYGNEQWSQTYGETNDFEMGRSVVQTSDGGFLLAGYILQYSGPLNEEFLVVKTDSSGNEQWSKTFGGSGNDRAFDAIQTSDGGYAIVGYTYSYGSGQTDFWLVKTNSAGTKQWDRTYGGAYQDRAVRIVQTSDGGYAMAGCTNSYGSGGYDFWLVKTDSSGNKQWDKTYGGSDYDWAFSLHQTSDGGYAIAGDTDSYGSGMTDFWLVKTDSAGNKQWSQTYGGSATSSDTVWAMDYTSDGGYIIVGDTDRSGNWDFWVVKTTSTGSIQWSQTYGGTSDDHAASVQQTADLGYIIAGITESYGAGQEDFWLIKLEGGNLDGEISSWNVLTPELEAGDQLRVQVTVDNIGEIRADYNVYIGNIWDSEGQSAGNGYSESHQIIQLDSGASQTLTLVWTTPPTMQPGDYTGDLWLQLARSGGGWENNKQYSHAISFTVVEEEFTITLDPNGGRIYVDSSPITSIHYYTWAKDSIHNLDTDSGYEPSGGTKLIFNQWSDGNKDDPRSLTVTGDATYTTQWDTQYYVTFQQSGCGGTPHVTVDGGPHTLPYSTWMDSGSSHNFVYESPVTEGENQWVLTSTSHSPPLTVTEPTTVTGYYSLEGGIELYYDDGVAEGGWGTSTLPHYKAVRFHAPTEGAYKLRSAKYYITSDPSSFELQIRDVSASMIYSETVTPTETGWFTVDLSSQNIYVQGDFYVALKYLSVQQPKLGGDTSDPDLESGEGQGFPAPPNLVSLDWMIRAVLGENQPPTAYIDGIHPSPADEGETVYFSGHGDDPDGSVVDWLWESSIDGPLSSSSSFSTSSLSVGTHTIYFYVKDNGDVWSSPDTETLRIWEKALLYVKLVSSDDDYHSVDVYVDGEYWGFVDSNPRLTTYSIDKEVSPNTEHVVEIGWHDDDCGGKDYSRTLIRYVGAGDRIEFQFDIVMPFWVSTGTIQWTTIDTTLEGTGDHCYFHVATSGIPDWAYENFDISQLVAEFETIYNVEIQEFGQPPDIDEDDHIYVLVYDCPYAGYFDPRNQKGRNYAEIIHIYYGLATTGPYVNQIPFGRLTLAHEFNHVIMYNYDEEDEKWLQEGMAEYATYVVYGSESIYPDPGSPNQLTDHIAYFLDLNAYGTTKLIWNEYDGEQLYGAAWLFMQYLAEKYGHSTVKGVFQDIDNGRQSVEEQLPAGITFDSVFRSWVIANYLDLDTGPYSYEQIIEIQGIIAENTFSHFASSDVVIEEQGHGVEEWAADYIRFSTSETHLKISFDGDWGILSPSFEVKVLLIKGDFSSYSIISMTLAQNEGTITVGPLLSDDANSYSQIVLMTVRDDDLFLGDAHYTYRAQAYTTSFKVEAQSPVNIMVTAPNGLSVGYDPKTGCVINEIPGAIYSGPSTEPQEVFIPNPLSGNYIVYTSATGTGSYAITLESTANGSIVDSETWEGTVVPDQQCIQTINLSTDGEITSVYDVWTGSFAETHPIVDFAVYNGTLYAASDNNLYVYDGNNWTTIQAPAYVLSLVPYEGELYIGGKGALYSYNGTDFTLVFSTLGYVKMLGIYNGTLYAGTVLDNPPTLFYCSGSADNPDNWYVDTAFSAILNFSGPFGSIDSFAVFNDTIYVTSGGTVYSHNGTDWSIVTTYVDVSAFLDTKVYNGKLYLATRDQAWRKPCYLGYSGFSGRVNEFDGNNWTTMFDHDYWIFSLETYNDKLYVGTANKIYTYNGTDWSVSFESTEGAYYAISFITFNNTIYAGMGNGYIFVDPSSKTVQSETVTVPEFPSFFILPLFMTITLQVAIVYRKKKWT